MQELIQKMTDALTPAAGNAAAAISAALHGAQARAHHRQQPVRGRGPGPARGARRRRPRARRDPADRQASAPSTKSSPLLNEGLATVRKSIARFFDAKHRDDLLLLYFSGHGVRDEQGHLYLAVRDTERAVLAGTAIEASYVTTRMDRSASKRLVLVLDCCHSGAFGLGAKSAQGATVGTASAFEGTGRGRVVLTATDSTQFAWEGDQVIGDVENSLFTHYLIEGLRTRRGRSRRRRTDHDRRALRLRLRSRPQRHAEADPRQMGVRPAGRNRHRAEPRRNGRAAAAGDSTKRSRARCQAFASRC